MAQCTYLIRDLEKMTGIKAHTIRIWEKRYQVVKPKRTSTNIRYYCDEDLKRLLNISALIKQGFKISQLAELGDDELNEKIMNAYSHESEETSRIDNLVTAMIDLDEPRFEKTIHLATLNMGFEHTILNIIYPFLERIGILWLTGTINPAQEHFVSNLLRQKLLVAIDNLIVKPARDSKRFILFLPENELHELGLLFYSYLVRKSGHKIIYL
ncbi:MAG TPA: MerR family transcriptional regulator, partial [Bacteroidales bacterium]|nr:MerR family transcriptional regulator [Bacteroidales bacterium]